MGKLFDVITPELRSWVEQQRMFFVATAPASAGLVNCSPKGMDTFRVLGPLQVGYLDLTGSGIETVAHVRENGRIVFMFCAFDGLPKIVRLHGDAKVVLPGTPAWAQWRPAFPPLPGDRAIIVADIHRVSDSCGFGVPRLDYVGERDTLRRSIEAKGAEGLAGYQRDRNASSIDGLPGLAR